MVESIDVHNYKRRLERRLELIERSKEITRRNKDAILEFQKDCFARGLSAVRIEKYLYHLYNIALMLRKPFEEAGKEDILKIVEEIERRKWSDRTKYDYKISLRIFFRWLRKREDYPEEVKWIKPRLKNGNRLPEEILTEEEIKAMAEKAENPRDRALILCLYESGCRIGELLTLKIKNAQFDEHGAVLLVNGKTGSRRVRIIASASALMNWLEHHPLNDNREAFVWIDVGTRNRYERMSYSAVREVLRKLAKEGRSEEDG
ncbi:MAG: tyrosine-type recombinase/integrase [Nitrososphaerales archaeon]